jgi:hypothetical protein
MIVNFAFSSISATFHLKKRQRIYVMYILPLEYMRSLVLLLLSLQYLHVCYIIHIMTRYTLLFNVTTAARQ